MFCVRFDYFLRLDGIFSMITQVSVGGVLNGGLNGASTSRRVVLPRTFCPHIGLSLFVRYAPSRLLVLGAQMLGLHRGMRQISENISPENHLFQNVIPPKINAKKKNILAKPYFVRNDKRPPISNNIASTV